MYWGKGSSLPLAPAGLEAETAGEGRAGPDPPPADWTYPADLKIIISYFGEEEKHSHTE